MKKQTLIMGFKNGKELKFKDVSLVNITLDEKGNLFHASWSARKKKVLFADTKEIAYIYTI